jgi:hypothetical protein
MSTCSVTQNLHYDIAMRKWTSLGVVICFAAAVAMAADKEPEYQGHSLSYWASQIDPHVSTVVSINGVAVPPPAHQTAIEGIGTNALPTLLKWIAQEDVADTSCLHPSWGMQAEWCFGILGSAARPAIPQLMALALKFPDRQRYDRCINVLVDLAPDSTPSLKQILDKGPDGKRFTVVEAFALLDTNSATLLLPGVIKCLTGRDENLGWRAAQSLSESSLSPQLILPALTNAVPFASTAGRGRIFRCLYWSKYPAKEAVPILRKSLLSSNTQIRQEATWALQRIAPEVLTNAPAK